MAAELTLVEPAVPVRVKATRNFQIPCDACGHKITVDRALFIGCPTCDAIPGTGCVDMRSKDKGKIVLLTKIHPARISALKA